MTRLWENITVVILAASLIVSAMIVRSGLVAIATQIRDKSMKLPEQIHLSAGDSRNEFNNVNLSMKQLENGTDAKLSIDDIHVTKLPLTGKPSH